MDDPQRPWFLGVPGYVKIPNVIHEEDEKVLISNIEELEWDCIGTRTSSKTYTSVPTWLEFLINQLLKSKMLTTVPKYIEVKEIPTYMNHGILVNTTHTDTTTVYVILGHPVMFKMYNRFNYKMCSTATVENNSVVVQDNNYPHDWFKIIRASKNKKSYLLTIKHDKD